jgi:hypothetical protein
MICLLDRPGNSLAPVNHSGGSHTFLGNTIFRAIVDLTTPGRTS